LFDAFQNVRRNWARAAVRKNRVSESELCQCDFAAAKERRRIWAKVRTNSRCSTKLQTLVQTRLHSDPDGGAVLRFRKRLPRCHCAFVAIVRAFRTPFPKNSGH